MCDCMLKLVQFTVVYVNMLDKGINCLFASVKLTDHDIFSF